MKNKLLIALCIGIAFVFSSCKKNALNVDPNSLDNVTFKCWFVTVKQTNAEVSTSDNWHIWSHERGLVIYLQKEFSASNYSVTYKEDTKYLGPSACEEADK